MGKWRFLLVVLLGIAALSAPVYGASGAAFVNQIAQTPLFTQYEAQVVYYSNLERVAQGIAPLRWNRELTNSARWFAWDTVENRTEYYCGHQDTRGEWPQDRNQDNDYYGRSGAENAYCGFLLPNSAVAGWMTSDGHRGNILDPNSREIGVGYYQRALDGKGYVVQDFGNDPYYPPVVIDNEALNTTSSQVNLYIYSAGDSTGGFDQAEEAVKMRVSNTPCLEDVDWQPYQSQLTWNLLPGEGWRTVYVQTKDAFGRYFTVSDTIYQGAHLPLEQLGQAQMSRSWHSVDLYNKPPAGTVSMQYSLGWAADETFSSFHLWWGNGQSTHDSQAWGGKAFRMYAGNGESFAWVYTTDFYKNVPLVAYFRLKVSSNSGTGEVARIAVQGGSSPESEIRLKANDFTSAGAYQEFAIPFTFIPNSQHPFLFFKIWRSGQPDVYFDAVTIFSRPQPLASPLELDLSYPLRYRGQTLWLRWLDASGAFSSRVEAITTPPSLSVSPSLSAFLAGPKAVYPPKMTLAINQLCGNEPLAVNGTPSWLKVSLQSGKAVLTPDPSGLSPGPYNATLTFSVPSQPSTPSVKVTVRMRVSTTIFQSFMPVITR